MMKSGSHTQTDMKLIAFGARCAIVYGHTGVDKFVAWLKENKHTQPKVQVIFK